MIIQDFAITHIVKVTDGDTLTAHLSRVVGELDDFDVLAQTRRGHPARIRLVHLDTPEKGHAGYADATRDLTAWLGDGHDLRMTAATKDAFGRYVGDVYRAADRAATASDHMVRERGWAVWTR